MKLLARRVQRLEARTGAAAPLPWERPGWEQCAEAEMLEEMDWYVAAYPDSALARKWRAIEALPDRELMTLLVDLEAQFGEAP
jgi:hypothetical protein